MTLLNSAKSYKIKGISIVATDENKRAIVAWKPYQSKIATDDEINTMFSYPKCKGVAVICGAVSGNLEVIDIDLKNDISGYLFEQLFDNCPKSIWDKLRIVETKNKGIHLYYRCKTIEGNLKLANRPATEVELKDNPHIKQIVLIETRGEGGYAVAPPTEGYKVLQDVEVSYISEEERNVLLELCRSFNEIVEPVAMNSTLKSTAQAYGKTSWDDFNERGDVCQILTSHGWTIVKEIGERVYFKRPGKTDSVWSGDYHKGLNLFKVFTTSSNFEANKGYTPFAVYATLEHNGNFSEAAKDLFKKGYGTPAASFDKKKANKVNKALSSGHSTDKVVEMLMVEDQMAKKEAEAFVEDLINNSGERILGFWEVNETKQGKQINILRYKFIDFLFDNGFHLYFYDKNSNIYRIIEQRDGFVNEATSESIKKFIINYIENLPPKFDSITPNELKEVVLKGADTYFGKGLIEFLNRKVINLLKDEPEVAYFPFKNGIVKVTKDGAKLHTYSDINKCVWQSEVIDFNIDVDPSFDYDLCEFYDFMKKISGSDEKLLYLVTLTGYLLHRYKDPSRPYAVILAEETEDEKKGGGTGKGIFVKALSYMANVERVDGKNFKIDKNFAFQRVGLDTKIVAIEDVRKNVDFESFYSIITEGITVEKKNKDELFIPYKDSPKILFTTNYTISGVGVHAKRRQQVFEFASFFSDKLTPLDHFGHKLFDDWDDDEWNRFYNLMFTCVALYLSGGIKSLENSVTMHRKHIRLNFGEDFLDWLDDYNQKGPVHFRDLYQGFLQRYDLDKKDYSQKRFSRAIEESCERLGYKYKKGKNKQTKLPEVTIETIGNDF